MGPQSDVAGGKYAISMEATDKFPAVLGYFQLPPAAMGGALESGKYDGLTCHLILRRGKTPSGVLLYEGPVHGTAASKPFARSGEGILKLPADWCKAHRGAASGATRLHGVWLHDQV